MKTKLTLDSAAGIFLGVLIVLVGGLMAFAGLAGLRVSANLPEDGLVSPLQTIRLTFSEAVDTEMASSVISMEPVLEGYLEWLDDRTVQFVPVQPFEYGTVYELTISPEVLTANGHSLKKRLTWIFAVRAPMVAYLSSDVNDGSIWAMDQNGGSPRRLTEGIKVISFDTARSGDFLVFSSANPQGGVNLWRVSRSGEDMHLLLDCGADRCTMPSISPNGLKVAYSREAAGPTPDLPYGSPRIWVLEISSGQNNPLYEDQQTLGIHPSWSPDSTRLASFDGLADRINIFDFQEKKQYSFSSNTGGPITWSPDSNQVLFTRIEQSDNGLRTHVLLGDISMNQVHSLLGTNDEREYAYYSLAWSRHEDQAILGFRESEENPAQIFWLFNPSLLDGVIIADQPEYTYNSPQWNPWGTALVFQQFKLKGAFQPEIGVWASGMEEPLVLTQGLMPHWLP